MIFDMQKELRDFTYITNVYKCISNYHLKGHQIGRKVGDMLEILTMGAIDQNEELRARLATEEKLEGYTTAGHKVEFGFFNTGGKERQLFGAIECKCVGVEETTSGKNGKNLRHLCPNESFSLPFSMRWQLAATTFTLKLLRITDARTVEISIVSDPAPRIEKTLQMSVGENLKVVIDEDSHCLVARPKGNMLDEIPGIIRILKNIRLQAISKGRATFALFDCLTGPQTIEKAKQASFVAMDLRKKIDGFWGKEEIPPGKKHMTFVHVICEYSHWEKKSRDVIRTCIDHNVIVPDAVIIRAFDVFETEFGVPGMLNKISKKEYEKDAKVRSAIQKILDFYEQHVFYDVALNRFVQFRYSNHALAVVPLP